MEPEIIIHMKKLSLQDQDSNSINAQIEINKKRYSEQFFTKNVNSTNELISHLKCLSLGTENANNTNESPGMNRIQNIDNIDNIQKSENNGYKNGIIFDKDRIPLIQLPSISQMPNIPGIVEDFSEKQISHIVTVGRFMPQTFENRDLCKSYARLASPITSSTSASVKSSRKCSRESSARSYKKQESQIQTTFYCQDNKRIDVKKLMSLNKRSKKRNKNTSLDIFTPRTWDSWTSSTLSSIPTTSSRHILNQKINYHIPWKKLINKEVPPVDNVTSLYRFAEVFEPRHGTRHGTQRKFRPEVIRNAQWPSNDFFTCLLCEKSGHFCHECEFYSQSKFHFNHLSPKTLLDVIRDIDYDIKNSNITLDEKTNTSLASMDDTSKSMKLMKLHTINEIVGKKNTPSYRCFPSVDPLLSIYNEIEFRNSKDNEILAHVFRIKQLGHNHKFGLACKKLYNIKKKKYSNCSLCGSFGHPTNKCPVGSYCRSVGKINSPSCRFNINQAAQVSFHINPAGAQLPSVRANPEFQQFLCYQATTKMNRVETTTKKLAMRKINVHDSMYKVSEADYENFLMCKNKNDSSIMNLLKCGQSVSVIVGKVNGKETTMFVDTGSTITSITEELVEQLNIQPQYTNHILTITLANTQVEEYSERLCIVALEVGDVECYETLTVLPGQLYDITLGKNWLKAHMAICDHGLDILRIPGSRPIKMGFTPPMSKP
jgi:predicted aspartyl protease